MGRHPKNPPKESVHLLPNESDGVKILILGFIVLRLGEVMNSGVELFLGV